MNDCGVRTIRGKEAPTHVRSYVHIHQAVDEGGVDVPATEIQRCVLILDRLCCLPRVKSACACARFRGCVRGGWFVVS